MQDATHISRFRRPVVAFVRKTPPTLDFVVLKSCVVFAEDGWKILGNRISSECPLAMRASFNPGEPHLLAGKICQAFREVTSSGSPNPTPPTRPTQAPIRCQPQPIGAGAALCWFSAPRLLSLRPLLLRCRRYSAPSTVPPPSLPSAPKCLSVPRQHECPSLRGP